MNQTVHLQASDLSKVFEQVQRPQGTPETFTSDWPYEIDTIHYEANEDEFTFTAVGTITKTDEVCPDAVKAAHLKQLFEETAVAILRHSGEAGNAQWIPLLTATITTREKTPPGKIHFSGQIKIKRRESKGPVLLLNCAINPNVTYKAEGRIIDNPTLSISSR